MVRHKFHPLFICALWLMGCMPISPAFSANLLVFGDSLSAGYGMEDAESWPTLLQTRLNKITPKVQVVNASISGETTSGGRNRLSALLQQYQPKWVILELGANDALRGQNLQTVQQNLQTMIESIQARGGRILLLGIRLPTNYGPAYDRALQNMFARLADRYHLLFDPFFLESVALDPDMMQADGLHPNAQAQTKILNRLWPQIKTLVNHAAP